MSANKGHGHVIPRADGMKARCGGPSLCQECWQEKVDRDRAMSAAIRPTTVAQAEEESATLLAALGSTNDGPHDVEPTPCTCGPHCRNRSVPHEPRRPVEMLLYGQGDQVLRVATSDAHFSRPLHAFEAEEACNRVADGAVRALLGMMGLHQTGYIVSVKLDFSDPPGVYFKSSGEPHGTFFDNGGKH